MKKSFNSIIALLLLLCPAVYGTNETDLIAPEQIKEDIRYLRECIESVHPTLSHTDYSDQLEHFSDGLEEPISKWDLFRAIQPIVSVDGHTTFVFSDRVNPDVEDSSLPLEVVVFKDRIYVKKNHSLNPRLKQKSEILSIQGIPAGEILKKTLQMIPGERVEYKTSKLSGGGFSAFYKLAFGESELYSITIATETGPEKMVLKGVPGEVFRTPREPMWSYSQLEPSIGLISVHAFKKPAELKALIDETFSQIEQDGIKDLIIDVRGGGGFSDLAEYCISFLTSVPYRQYEKKITKVSDESADWVESNEDAGRYEGDYFILEPVVTSPPEREKQFKGQIYIITGAEAYSTMSMFVAMAKECTNAIIIGEETGQPLVSNGDISRHQLPNSQLKFYLSHSIYYMPGSQNDKNGVIPDIIVQPTLDDLMNDENIRLRRALTLIHEKRL